MRNRWGDSGKSVRLYFLDSKITAYGDYSHKISFLLGRKVMTKLYSILKSRDITLPTKVHLVKAVVFPVVMYGCESWTVKKAEHQKIDAVFFFGGGGTRVLFQVDHAANRTQFGEKIHNFGLI